MSWIAGTKKTTLSSCEAEHVLIATAMAAPENLWQHEPMNGMGEPLPRIAMVLYTWYGDLSRQRELSELDYSVGSRVQRLLQRAKSAAQGSGAGSSSFQGSSPEFKGSSKEPAPQPKAPEPAPR